MVPAEGGPSPGPFVNCYRIVTVLTLMRVFPGTLPLLTVMWVGPMELTNMLVHWVLILPKLLMPPTQTAVCMMRLTLALVALRTRPTPPSVRVARLLVALLVSLLAAGLTFSRLDMNMNLPVPIVRSHVFSVIGVLDAVIVLTPLSTIFYLLWAFVTTARAVMCPRMSIAQQTHSRCLLGDVHTHV